MTVRTLLLLMLVGCGGQAASTADPSDAANDPPSSEQLRCLVEAVVVDGEDNNHQVHANGQRNGYIYTFTDDLGTEVTPVAGSKGGTFAMTEGGANGSLYALRFSGRVATGEVVYAGVGINFVDPKASYDASSYSGIAFYARHGEGSVQSLRLKVPDANTDPAGEVCSECFNDFGATLTLTPRWKRYAFAFGDLGQLPGWGAPRPSAVKASALYGVQLQVDAAGGDYDIWVDDVTFVGCP